MTYYFLDHEILVLQRQIWCAYCHQNFLAISDSTTLHEKLDLECQTCNKIIIYSLDSELDKDLTIEQIESALPSCPTCHRGRLKKSLAWGYGIPKTCPQCTKPWWPVLSDKKHQCKIADPQIVKKTMTFLMRK